MSNTNRTPHVTSRAVSRPGARVGAPFAALRNLRNLPSQAERVSRPYAEVQQMTNIAGSHGWNLALCTVNSERGRVLVDFDHDPTVGIALSKLDASGDGTVVGVLGRTSSDAAVPLGTRVNHSYGPGPGYVK